MKLLSWKGLAIMGVIATLLVGGLAVVITDNASATNDQTPDVNVSDQSTATTQNQPMHNLTVTVGAKVEGKKVPIEGATVQVYSVNVTSTQDTITIVLQKVAEAKTNSTGMVTFDLEQDKYIIVAHYHGLKGFGKVNLTEDESRRMMLHNWNSEGQIGKGEMKNICFADQR